MIIREQRENHKREIVLLIKAKRKSKEPLSYFPEPSSTPIQTRIIKVGGKQKPERFKIDVSQELDYIGKAFISALILILLWKVDGYMLFDLYLNQESHYYYEHAAAVLIPALQFLDHLISTTLKAILYFTTGLFFLIPILEELKAKEIT